MRGFFCLAPAEMDGLFSMYQYACWLILVKLVKICSYFVTGWRLILVKIGENWCYFVTGWRLKFILDDSDL